MSDTVAELVQSVVSTEQKARNNRAERGRIVLKASGLPFKFDGTVASLRKQGFPTVDYHMDLGRWRVGTAWKMGDATALIDWIESRVGK